LFFGGANGFFINKQRIKITIIVITFIWPFIPSNKMIFELISNKTF